jgi:hypothetical protein
LVNFNKRNVEAHDPGGERKPCATYAGTQIGYPFAGAPAGRRGQQDRVMADPVTALGLAQP